MEFPFGHHSHTHTHHRRDDGDDEPSRNRPYPPPGSAFPPGVYGQPPPPRPDFYGGGGDDFAPPPPPPSTVYHTSHSHPPSSAYPPPPRDDFGSGYTSPYPAPSQVYSHGSTEYSGYAPRPATVEHVAHGGGALASYFAYKLTYNVHCKADPNYSLAIRDSKVVLARSDSSDPYQKWYKDEKYSTRVKDEEGSPCFSLVNKATGQALKHSVGASHPVQLVPYNPEQLDSSVLWTESKDLGDGYRTIRMVNNVRLNMDAFHGDKSSGGVHDGTTVVLWQWNHGDNQRWKINSHCKFLRR